MQPATELLIGGVLALLATATITAPAIAAGDERAGRALVNRLCVGCHAIAIADPSPHPNAPPLATIVRRYRPTDLAEALAEGIVVRHHPIPMPQFTFTPEETDDLIAFFEALRRAAGR